MGNLIFSLNSTVPVFLVIVLGYVLKKIKFLNESFTDISDKLVFKVTLPVMLFNDMSNVDIYNDFDLRYVLFCAGVTTVAFFSIWLLSKIFIKDKSSIGEFVQACYRSSAAILGEAYILNIYGNAGMVPLMMIGSVPLFNVYAVLVLTLESPQKISAGEAAVRIRKAFINILKNPIIDGIAIGVLASALKINFPVFAVKTFDSIGGLTTPLALIAIGSSFEFSKLRGKLRLTAIASFIKLFVLPAIFLPLALHLEFTNQKLIALIVMLGSCSTPTCYVMAKNMGHEGVLTSGAIVLTTLFSTVSLTFWIFMAKSLGYII